MDRKRQLANVSFGGAWSEQIAGNEAMIEAMARIEAAAAQSEEEDLRSHAGIRDALKILAAAHPKGSMLSAAWEKALGIDRPGLRSAELARIAATLRAGLGKRLQH